MFTYIYIYVYGASLVASGKESACNAGDASDVGSIPVLEGSTGGGFGNPLHYSCFENPVD